MSQNAFAGLVVRVQVLCGVTIAVIRYMWVVKEDRSKDFTRVIPSAALYVILNWPLKLYTMWGSSEFLICRSGTNLKQAL